MQKKKVLFVATVVKTHIMEFHIPYLKMFKEMGYETAVAARNDYENPDDCRIPYCDHFFDIPFQREPFVPHRSEFPHRESYRTLFYKFCQNHSKKLDSYKNPTFPINYIQIGMLCQ